VIYPFLSLATIYLDEELARKLPYRLAAYHLALPIAYDEGQTTVAMAYPDNPNVLSILASTLQTPIIPVQADPGEIRRALEQIWQRTSKTDTGEIIFWQKPDFPAAIQSSVHQFANAFVGQVRDVSREIATLDDLLPAGAASRLLIVATDEVSLPLALFRQTAASVLLLRQPLQPPLDVLQVLRGHMPDRKVLDWLLALGTQGQIRLTLLTSTAISESRRSGLLSSTFASMIDPKDEQGAALAEYARLVADAKIEGRLKIRQDSLDAAALVEVTSQSYNLLAVAAEAYGDFVHGLWQQLHSNVQAFLVVKP
jgi:hypothetical protein